MKKVSLFVFFLLSPVINIHAYDTCVCPGLEKPYVAYEATAVVETPTAVSTAIVTKEETSKKKVQKKSMNKSSVSASNKMEMKAHVSTPTVEEVLAPTPKPTYSSTGNGNTPEKVLGSFYPEKRVHLGVRFGQHLLKNPTWPNGFYTLNTGTYNFDIFLLWKFTERIGIEFSGYVNPIVSELRFFKESLGKKSLTTQPTFILDLFPFKKYLYLGAGAEYTSQEGNYSVGGANFEGSHTEWSPVFHAGINLPLFNTKRLEGMADMNYRISQISLTSTIPSKGDYTLMDTGFISIGVLGAW